MLPASNLPGIACCVTHFIVHSSIELINHCERRYWFWRAKVCKTSGIPRINRRL